MADVLERLKAALADRYEIEAELGSGGMATVYLAQDLKHERQVAIKVLRPELAAALGGDRFHQEIKIAANLTHPHILPLHDSGDADGLLYYVMPHIEGESLREKLAHEGELPIGEAVRILRDVVDALSEAHEKGVVHRDIKPDNVLLTKHHALVTDFGVAKAVSDATGAHQLTTEGVALGTPAYMSPEQAAADKHIDHRADIYAVGAVAYELLTGRPPFTGTTPQELLSAQVTQTPDPVTKYRESVPPALEQLVMKCLEKKAADRWQSADELLPQLEALATPSGGITPTDTVPVYRVAKRRWMMAAGAVAAAAVIAVIAIVATLPRGGGVALDPERIVVAVIRNETGDPSLDQAGRQAGHWITQGLQQTGIVQVVPWETALQSSQYVSAEAEAGRVRDRVQALAEETGAGTVISGAYYRRGDAIQYQLEITDAASGRLLTALDPEDAPLDSPDVAMEPLRQRVLGALAISFDERISAQASAVVQPPSYEAYQAFDEGMRHFFRLEYREALPYLYQAFELDTTFVSPLIYAVINLTNLAEWAEADSLVDVLERTRNRLSEYDRHWLDYLKARVEGDWAETLDAIRRAAELAPGSKAVYHRGLVAMRHNRPQEAVDALLSLDPERGPMRGWPSYHVVLAHCYLMLDQFENALDAVRRGRAAFGDDAQRIAYEAFALTGLGRVEEVNALVDEMTALPDEGQFQGPGWYTRRIAVFLRRHGHVDAARSTIERAIDWYEGRPSDTNSTTTWRYPFAVALYAAGRCDESYGVAKPLSEEFPDSYTYRGFVGMVAACRGDREEALETSQWLEAYERPYLYGRNTIFRSAIAAALGDGESAVTLWRQARAEGLWLIATTRMIRMMGPGDGRWIAFEPIRDYPPWQELIRPKG
jgi:tetratricopeptide (TPR) repeat protein